MSNSENVCIVILLCQCAYYNIPKKKIPNTRKNKIYIFICMYFIVFVYRYFKLTTLFIIYRYTGIDWIKTKTTSD